MIPSSFSLSLLLGALPAQVPFATFEGSHRNEQLGYVVRFAGDVNADGYDDILVTAPFPLEDWGYAGVYSGADGTELYRWSFFGFSADIDSVDTAGDMDGDGYSAVILGGVASGLGRAVVISGRTGKPIHFLETTGGPWLGGLRVAGGGDVNGDGVPDFLVTENNSTMRLRRVRVRSGVDASTLALLEGNQNGRGSDFGIALDFLGDLDGDGCDDFGVGDKDAPTSASDEGLAEVISGKTAATLFQFFDPQDGDWFGHAVAGVGDVNADGVPDIGVGAPFYKYPTLRDVSGLVRIYSGSDGSVMYEIFDSVGYSYAGVNIGYSVSGAGDVNHDGHADFLVGDWFASRAMLYSGKDGALLTIIAGTHDVGAGLGGPHPAAATGTATAGRTWSWGPPAGRTGPREHTAGSGFTPATQCFRRVPSRREAQRLWKASISSPAPRCGWPIA